MNRLPIACAIASLLGILTPCPAQDEAKDAEIRLLKAEIRLLKKENAELKEKLDAATRRSPPPSAGGATGGQPTTEEAGEQKLTASFSIYEDNPAWWTDASSFVQELQLRECSLVQSRHPNEIVDNWLDRHNMFADSNIEWRLGLYGYSKITEVEAGKSYYQRKADLKKSQDQLEAYRKITPVTTAVRENIAVEERKVRALETDLAMWQRLLETKGGVSLRAVFREFRGGLTFNDALYVRVTLPPEELDRLSAYEERKKKENPDLHAVMRVWPVTIKGKVFSWGKFRNIPELYVDGQWSPAAGK